MNKRKIGIVEKKLYDSLGYNILSDNTGFREKYISMAEIAGNGTLPPIYGR